MAPVSLNISPWGAMGDLFLPKLMHDLGLQKVQLSEKVHHWTLDGSYGSSDFKPPINVPMKLSSFDVGSLVSSIFGKLKLPSQPRAEDVPLRSGMEYPHRGNSSLRPFL